jgi:hypothetical protein
VKTPILDLRLVVLDAICRAQKLPESAERTTTLDHLRFAARVLLPLVQAEENETTLTYMRDRDTMPAPPPITPMLPPPIEPSDVASHWSLSHE